MTHVKHDPHGPAPDADAIAALARDAWDRLPAFVRDQCAGVRLVVEELADDDTLAGVGLDHPLDLTGLYDGRPRTVAGTPDAPDGTTDRVILYRQAMLVEWATTDVRLDDLVAHVLIHEIGHHLGFSDDDMDAIEQGLSRGPSL